MRIMEIKYYDPQLVSWREEEIYSSCHPSFTPIKKAKSEDLKLLILFVLLLLFLVVEHIMYGYLTYL